MNEDTYMKGQAEWEASLNLPLPQPPPMFFAPRRITEEEAEWIAHEEGVEYLRFGVVEYGNDR